MSDPIISALTEVLHTRREEAPGSSLLIGVPMEWFF